ncbi:hypothetical protein F5146DRAFT_1003917 [Armillaria mellea]|nr:hypothetical protein F5146DRAFT_1003917 [Armillaria mellea]
MRQLVLGRLRTAGTKLHMRDNPEVKCQKCQKSMSDNQPILEDDRTRTLTPSILAISDQSRPDATYIHTEYHPSSGQDSKEDLLEEYLACREKSKVDIDDSPWHPFKSKLDFELVEFILQAGLNEGGIDSLLKNIFTKTTFSVLLGKQTYKFDVHHQDLWSWTLDIIQDPVLALHLIWDAQRLFKCKGNGTSERVYTEPWTSNIFWEVQLALPVSGKPICYIIYADKTWLSSFGTVQGYPVIIRLGNLPAHIYNGQGVGGGHVIGWLPIVPKESQHHDKMYYADFKRAVWHKAFEIILSSIQIMKSNRNEFLKGFGLRFIEVVLILTPRLSTFPPWKDLYHFKQGFTRLTFMDGWKYEMLSKLPQSRTSKAANTGCPNSEYEKIKQAALDAGKQPPKKLIFKTWDFPKVHLHKHLFDDIEAKGVMLNYNTKLNESMHGAFKESYQWHTNFEDFEKQILQIDQWYNAMSFIHQQIDAQEEWLANSAEEKDSDEINDSNQPEREMETANSQPDYVSAASVHGNQGKGGGRPTITEVEVKAVDNPDFSRFRKLLSKYMAQHFKSHPEELPLINGAAVAFESFAPNDQLVMVFKCTVCEKIFPLILIWPFDQPMEGLSTQKDQDLGFYHVGMDMKKSKPCLVSIYTVLWGALLIEDPDIDPKDEDVKEYLVVDVVDADMEINHSIMLLAGKVYTPAGVEEQAKAASEGALGNNLHTFNWGHLSHINSPCSLSAKVFRLQSYLLLSKEKICQVKCGANHVLVLTTDRHVLIWGFGTCGELGHKEQHHTSSLKPERPSLSNIVTIGARSHQSFAVDSSGLPTWWSSGPFSNDSPIPSLKGSGEGRDHKAKREESSKCEMHCDEIDW